MLRIVQKRVMGSLRAQCTRMMSNGSTDSAVYDDEEGETNNRRKAERGMNKVTLIGRVGREPEHRGSQEHPCIIFPLATNFTYRKANGEQMTKTDWHRVCVFRPGLRDNVASRIERGDRLFVEGSISYTRYTDAENRTNNITSIVADDIMFLGRRNPGPTSTEGEGEI